MFKIYINKFALHTILNFYPEENVNNKHPINEPTTTDAVNI